MAKVTEFEAVMMNRDGMSRSEAKAERRRMRSEILDAIEGGADYGDIEDMLLDDCGLEMDYIFDLI